jgi:hypothetical protein
MQRQADDRAGDAEKAKLKMDPRADHRPPVSETGPRKPLCPVCRQSRRSIVLTTRGTIRYRRCELCQSVYRTEEVTKPRKTAQPNRSPDGSK